MIAVAAPQRAPWPAQFPAVDSRSRITAALQAAGLDSWTCTQGQECPNLMGLEPTAHVGYVWLRPHFTPEFEQIALPVETAVAELYVAARARLDTGAHPDTFATLDEALQVWERLTIAATEAGL